MSSDRALPPQRRQRLLDVAVAEFADAGYQGASLNRIIRICGMSKSSFYYYVDSKQALFDLVVTELGNALLEIAAPPEPHELAGPDYWSRLHDLVDHLTRLGRTDERFVAFGRLFSLADTPHDPTAPLARNRAAINAWLDEVLEVGRTSGAVRDDLPRSLQRELTLAVLWAMDAWMVQHLHDGDIADPELLATTEVDAVRRLLAPEQAGPRPAAR